jgi:hypothetical protein
VAFEEYRPPNGSAPVSVDFHLPASWHATASIAYGINNYGDVVGEYTAAGSTLEIGWEYHNFCYYQIQYKTSTGLSLDTQPRGINFARIVVGTYEDQRLTKPILNGFVESGGTPVTVNDGTNETGTDINNINDNDYIVGYHVGGGNHKYHLGFIAMCKGNGSPSSKACPSKPPQISSSCEPQLGTAGANDSAFRRRP